MNENYMTTKDCERILRTMAIGACQTEKEAIEYAIKQMKKAKKAKRWKRKYLELREKCYPRERRFTMPADVPLEQMNELVTIRRGADK